ncbi:hypothetical protein Tco_1335249 [Tanacetum coccineum]
MLSKMWILLSSWLRQLLQLLLLQLFLLVVLMKLIFHLVPIPSDEFAGGFDVPAGATTGPSADPSNKGKSPLLEEDPPNGALIAKRRRDFAAQRFQDKRNKPMTYAQQKAYMRTFVKNQSSTIYTTGWTMKHVKSFSDDQLKTEFDKIRSAIAELKSLKTSRILPTATQQPSEFSSQPTVPSAEPRTHSYGTRRKSLGARKKSSTELDLTADDRSFIRVLSDDSEINNDGDLQVLFESHEGGTGAGVWADQQQWVIRSWRHIWRLKLMDWDEMNLCEQMIQFIKESGCC